MKTDFSPSLRTSQTTTSPLRQAERTSAVSQTHFGGIDAALARQGSNTLERILSKYGSGVQATSTSSPSDNPFERLDSLTKQVNELFQKDPTVIDRVRADKQLYTSIRRISTKMLDRLPGMSGDWASSFRSYIAMAAKLDPIEPKPILP